MKADKNLRNLLITEGLKNGLPIALGYAAVSFAFGIFAVEQGLFVWQALLISMTNLTSAGQLSGVTLMAVSGSLTEIALSQLIINLRYSLMAISLSQKLNTSVKIFHRPYMAFFITDEIFAVSSSKKSVGLIYYNSLIILPFLGWNLGTLAGAAMGEILPLKIVSVLGIAIYGMFIAIIIPPAKKNKAVAGVITAAAALSCVIYYTPLSGFISQGFSIIICAVIVSGVFAFVFPVKDKEENNG